MAVEALVDAPVVALLDAISAVRSAPAPVGLEAARVAALAHASAELRGVFLRDLAAVDPSAHGARNPADLLTQTAGVPVWQARRDAALSRRLALVPGLAEQVAGGGLELDAALQLVRGWQALPSRLHDGDLAHALITLGQLVDLRDLRAKMDELLGALAPDVTDADLADARENAELTLVDVGARTRISGECDALTGEFLRQALHARAEADRGEAEPGADGLTGPQRTMAALVSLVHAAVGAGSVPGEPQLVVVTTVDDLARCADPHPDRISPDDAIARLLGDSAPGDPDASTPVTEAAAAGAAASSAAAAGAVSPAPPPRPPWTTRSRGGLPIGPRTLAALTCTSSLTRLVLSPLGHPLDSSPKQRQLSRRERRALEHRAGYRCQRAGCGRPAAVCVPHHVVPWALGGPSTQTNTVLLCTSCHHLLHDRQQPLLLTTGRRIGPRGWLDTGPTEQLLL